MTEDKTAENTAETHTEQGKSIENNLTKEEKSPLDEAKEILEENKKVLAGLTEERKKIEKITANAMMSGKGFVNQQQAPKEETAREYANKILSGKK